MTNGYTVTSHQLKFTSLNQESDEKDIATMNDEIEERYTGFCKLFFYEIVTVNYFKPGNKCVNKDTELEKKDFVLINYLSKPNTFKYGLIEKKMSIHKNEKRMLVRRNIDGSGKTGTQINTI